MLRYLYRRAQMKGLFGGSRGWTIVWTVLLGARMLKKLGDREAKAVYSEVLGPGETLLISHEATPQKGRRR